jgi:hypothetical protein
MVECQYCGQPTKQNKACEYCGGRPGDSKTKTTGKSKEEIYGRLLLLAGSTGRSEREEYNTLIAEWDRMLSKGGN